jgi:hypothetical protein
MSDSALRPPVAIWALRACGRAGNNAGMTLRSISVKLSDTQLTTPGFQIEPAIDASGTKTKCASGAIEVLEQGSLQTQATKKATNQAGKPKTKAASKQDRVLALLRRPDGATLDVLVEATGWQQHSIRGLLAGTVRNKLKLPLRSGKVDGTRVYRVRAGKPTRVARAGSLTSLGAIEPP